MSTTTLRTNGRPTRELLDAMPPHDEDAEGAVIAAILVDPTRLGEVLGVIDAHHFYVPGFRAVYSHLLRLRAADAPIDEAALLSSIKASDDATNVDIGRLRRLVISSGAPCHATYHAERVRDYAERRALIAVGGKFIRLAHDTTRPVDQIKAEAMDVLGPVNGNHAAVGAVLRSMADVQRQKLEWLWDGRIPMGKLTILAGNPGLGKTLVSMAITSAVSRGALWPERTCSAPLGSVVILTAEDDPADTIRPRLDAAGADVTKVLHLEGVAVKTGKSKSAKRVFCLENDLPALEGALTTIGDVRLLVIDPISAYMGRIDSHKNAEVRSVLTPLVELAQRFRVAVLGITHLTKGGAKERTPAIYRAMGSLAFIAAARAGWAIVKDANDPQRRLLLPVKNNLAADTGGLAYRIVEVDGVPTVAWEPEAVKIDVDEALSQPSDEERSEREEASGLLRELLADGAVEAKRVFRMAREAGHSEKTLRRAKTDLGVVAYKEGFCEGAKWFWKMPSEDGQHSLSTETWASSQTWPSSIPTGEENQ